jgi:hypothetical protein
MFLIKCDETLIILCLTLIDLGMSTICNSANIEAVLFFRSKNGEACLTWFLLHLQWFSVVGGLSHEFLQHRPKHRVVYIGTSWMLGYWCASCNPPIWKSNIQNRLRRAGRFCGRGGGESPCTWLSYMFHSLFERSCRYVLLFHTYVENYVVRPQLFAAGIP